MDTNIVLSTFGIEKSSLQPLYFFWHDSMIHGSNLLSFEGCPRKPETQKTRKIDLIKVSYNKVVLKKEQDFADSTLCISK